VKCRRRRSSPTRRESLLLRFGLISALITGLLAVVLTTWLATFIRTTNIDHARDTAEYSLKLSLHVMDVPAGQSAVITPEQLGLTTRLMQASVATGTFVGATSWSGTGIVTYAKEPGRIGKLEKIRPAVAAALSGHASTAIITTPLPGVPDPTERGALRTVGPLLEIYEPVHINGKLVAAVALYQPWHPVQRLIDRETHQMLLLVLAGLLVLWLGTMRLVLSASRRLRRQARENWELASHDALTGLPNRKCLEEKVYQALRISERSGLHVGLLLLDLDRFKEVNDTYGHFYGDLLLKAVGSRLSAVLRQGDFVARLGGDEFVIVLSSVGQPSEPQASAARMLEALSEPFRLDDVTLEIAASIGIATSPEDGTDCDALLRHADAGMYRAKRSGAGFATGSPNSGPDVTRLSAIS
jgi:diguanylate cyclase (GGDEF)-like protein